MCWSPQAFHLFICSWLASRWSQRSPSQQRFPWALQLKEQILKAQITDCCVFFKMPFRPCPSSCGRFLSADDGHDRCLQCLGFQHAEDVCVDDSCACCGHMSMTSLRSRLSQILRESWLDSQSRAQLTTAFFSGAFFPLVRLHYLPWRGCQGVRGHSPGGESGSGALVPTKCRHLEELSASPVQRL